LEIAEKECDTEFSIIYWLHHRSDYMILDHENIEGKKKRKEIMLLLSLGKTLLYCHIRHCYCYCHTQQLRWHNHWQLITGDGEIDKGDGVGILGGLRI